MKIKQGLLKLNVTKMMMMIESSIKLKIKKERNWQSREWIQFLFHLEQ